MKSWKTRSATKPMPHTGSGMGAGDWTRGRNMEDAVSRCVEVATHSAADLLHAHVLRAHLESLTLLSVES
jgi:hypothetical protein